MTLHEGLPVAGYQPQSSDAIATVNASKELEERVLRFIDSLAGQVDPRWLAISRTSIESGFMALNRSVFQPKRIALPEDVPEPKVPRGAASTQEPLPTEGQTP